MASIAFMMDPYPGHILPSFGLANELISQGHSVFYLGIADNEEFVTDFGFEYETIFKTVYPKGYIQYASEKDHQHFVPILSGELTPILEKRNPNLIISSYFLAFEALLCYYMHRIPQVLFNSHLRSPDKPVSLLCENRILELPGKVIEEMIDLIDQLGIPIEGIPSFIEPVNDFTELIACPKIFDSPQKQFSDNVHYIGPCLRSPNEEAQKQARSYCPPGKKIIYASMGSLPEIEKEASELFFQRMVSLMKDELASDWHLVLAVGNYSDVHLPTNTENVSIIKWAPQIEILEMADLALIHGGLGTIKECIYYGVPMIVFPRSKEMRTNALRVEQLRLGRLAEINDSSVSQIKTLIKRVSINPEIQTEIEKFKAIFREKNRLMEGAEIIEKFIKLRPISL